MAQSAGRHAPHRPGWAAGTGINEPLLGEEHGRHRQSSGHDGSGGRQAPGRSQAGQASRVLLNLINSGIGTSTVAMPLAVRTLGLGVAMGVMAVQAGLGILANHILSRESEKSDADSYHDLMHSRFGKWGGRAVAMAQMVNSLGKLVVWLIILADLIVGSSGDGSGLLPELLRAAGYPQAAEDGWYLRRWPWILLLAALATPVVSMVAARKGKAHAIHWLPAAEGSGARGVLEVVSVVPVMMGAAFTQNNINSMMSELHPYRQRLLDATQAIARLLTIAVFLTIGASNNLVFGGKLKPDVLLNYSAHGLHKLLPGERWLLSLSATVKLSFLVNGLLSLPMYLYPYQRNLWSALPRQDPEQRMGERGSFAGTNIASLAGCTLIAVLVPSIWKPLKLLGGTAVSCMAFIFPGMVVLRTYRQPGAPAATPEGQPTRWEGFLWCCGWVLVAVGLLQAAASIASQFI